MKRIPLFLSIIILITTVGGCRKKVAPTVPKRRMHVQTEKIVVSPLKVFHEGKRGGSFIRADITDLDTFNIITTHSRAVYNLFKLVYESLLAVNPLDGTIMGAIAKKYEITNSGYSVVLHLNQNVYFSDGIQCTADDVVYTFTTLYMNPDVDSKKIDALTIRHKLVRIQKIDSFTVRFDLPVPYRPFLYLLTKTEIFPKHILAPYIKQHGIESFNRNWGNPKDDLSLLIGSGPYMIAEYRPGTLLRLKRNPYYSTRDGGINLSNIPYLDEIIELINLDKEKRLLKFQIGELDFYRVMDTDLESGDFDSLLANRNEGQYTLYSAGQTFSSNHFLVLNQNPVVIPRSKSALFRDVRFRKALSYCIDRDKIISSIYRGYASAGGSPIRDSSPFFAHEPTEAFDPSRAHDLLIELGLHDNNHDGIMEYPSGKPITITLITNKDNPFRIKMAEIIRQGCRKAGIDIQIKSIEYDLLITKLLDTFDWEAAIIGTNSSIEPNDASWIWESKGPFHVWYPSQEKPSTEWEKRIDELFAMGRTSWSFETAYKYYREFQDIVHRQLPIIPILVPFQIFGFSNGYGNLVPTSVTYNSLGLMPYIYKK